MLQLFVCDLAGTRSDFPSFLARFGIDVLLHIAEQAGFNLVRVEDSTQEYEQTLRIWIENLLNADQRTRLFSSAYRSWMLYLIEIATCLNSSEAQAHRLVLRRRK